jgi:3-oxoacyl-[acyl-carrier protein] reductase
VNNAATWPTARVADMTEAEWNETLAVNLGGPFLCCREAVRRWRKHGRGGVIVNVSSQAAFYGATTGHAHYAAAKAGLVNFTMSLARETAAEGIRVNAVAPGFMSTDMIGDLREDETARCLARIPMGRIADPREVADVVTFLASARAGYMTGATVCVTGGMLMR